VSRNAPTGRRDRRAIHDEDSVRAAPGPTRRRHESRAAEAPQDQPSTAGEPRKRRLQLVLTCEHAGHRVPRAWAPLFRGADDVLASHRGWDPGAADLARLLARRLGRPLLVTTWSRLFVEANRSPTNPRIWSRFTAPLSKQERDGILERWWRPHREAVEHSVAAAAARGHVVHVAVHSFTPELDGHVRNADVTFLYDSRRRSEAAFCNRWMGGLHRHDPALRLRRNYPYLGKTDGFTAWLRRRYPETRYTGIELEVNQALVAQAGWRRAQEAIAASLREALGR